MARVVMARRLLHLRVVVTRPLPACWTACVPNGQPGSRIVAPRPPLLRRNRPPRHQRRPPLLPPAAIPVPNGLACWTAFVLVWLLASTKTAASPARAVAPPRAITNRLPVPPRRRKCPNPRRKSPHHRPATPIRRPLPSRCRLQLVLPIVAPLIDQCPALIFSRPPAPFPTGASRSVLFRPVRPGSFFLSSDSVAQCRWDFSDKSPSPCRRSALW